MVTSRSAYLDNLVGKNVLVRYAGRHGGMGVVTVEAAWMTLVEYDSIGVVFHRRWQEGTEHGLFGHKVTYESKEATFFVPWTGIYRITP